MTRMLLSLAPNVTLSAHLSTNPYTVKDYYDDLYNGIWESTIQGKKLTDGDKLMQKMAVSAALDEINKTMNPKGLVSDVEPIVSLSIDDIIEGGMDYTGVIRNFREPLKQFEAKHGVGIIASQLIANRISASSDPYGWQREVEVDLIDETLGYNIAMLDKIQKLVQSRLAGANAADKAHYQGILLQVKKALEQK